MARPLDDIARDYDRAEITALWFHDRITDRHHLLYGVAEMCPVEQKHSPPIETRQNGTRYAKARGRLSDERTMYATRVLLPDPREALLFYRAPGGRRLRIPLPRLDQIPASPDAEEIFLQSVASLTDEPPNECPLVISSSAQGITAALPSRLTALRLLSHFDVGGATRASLSSKELDRVSAFGIEHLGVDLARFGENLGAVHLCFANPVLRSFDETLSVDECDLIFDARVRLGRSIGGCTLELIDERSAGNGFHIRQVLQSPLEIIPLPASPHKLRTVLFGPTGDCLADDVGVFIRKVNVNMEVTSNVRRRLNLSRSDGGIETHDIHMVSAREPHELRAAEALPESPAEMIAREDRRREMQDLRESGTFFYFPGGASSREEARVVVRELLGKARDRFLLCDPYLSARDVGEFLLFVRRVGLPIRVLGSAWFLRQKRTKDSPTTHGEALQALLNDLRHQDSSLSIICRVLIGRDASSVHDRFLILDENAYLLGSSLNEFGARATTLFKVPDSASIRTEVEQWWDERSGKSRSLDEWLSGRETNEGDDL